MHNVTAHAVRHGKSIEVTVSGFLSDSCHQARIVDFYPGGGRIYVRDPDSAQVFIEESVKPGATICLTYLVPWSATIAIPDPLHDKVEVFVNNQEVVEVPVTTQGASSLFIVIARTDGAAPRPVGCSIVPKDAVYLAIYHKVFGPDTYAACQAWKAAHCGGI